MKNQPHIVLVHGAWADGSSWAGVIERLQAAGYKVTAPQSEIKGLLAISQGNGAGLSFKGIKGDIAMEEGPWQIKEKATERFLAEYQGSGEAERISVAFTSTAFEEINTEEKGVKRPAVPCQNKLVLKNGETCEVELKCLGTAGAKAPIEVNTTSWFVTDGKRFMKCT